MEYGTMRLGFIFGLIGVFVAYITLAPVGAHADDVCGADMYINDAGACVSCAGATGYYCPGDTKLHECPALAGRAELNAQIQSMFPNATIESVQFYPRSPATSVDDCYVVYMLNEERGQIRVIQRYSSTTDKYNVLNNWWWSLPNAKYYLVGIKGCWSSVVYNDARLCQAGGYCPGEPRIIACVDGYGPDIFGMYTCPDNTYSDAGASACTPCPDGYGNHGDTVDAHDGLSSCKRLCDAGAMKLHAGSHTFNIWPDGQCGTPAINIGLSGGKCCVNLENGTGGGINIKFGTATYHAVN